MRENKFIRLAILVYWTFFWGLSILDKFIPNVQHLWVGKDFFALFIKFFASLGLKEPIYATMALGAISTLEVVTFAFFLMAFIQFLKGSKSKSESWFFRAILSSVILFSLFSIGDQVFGDRFQLLEHGLFWLIMIASWVIFKFGTRTDNEVELWYKRNPTFLLLAIGIILTILTSVSIVRFSDTTYADLSQPVYGKEVLDNVYKFDFPFLADKDVWETTLIQFKKDHPDLEVTYVYTGPSELNSKKKTHMLLYVFTKED